MKSTMNSKIFLVGISLAAVSLTGCAEMNFGASKAPALTEGADATGQINVQHVVSPGGIEAWLVEEHSIPIIAINFAFQGGAYLDAKGKEGTAILLSGLLAEGAGPHDSGTVRQLLEENSITLSYGASLDALSGTLRTLTANKTLAFDLARLSLTDPRFDSEPVKRVRGQIQVALKNAAMDPEAIASQALYENLFAGHAYSRPVQGTAETLAGISTKDLRNFLKAGVTRDRLKVGVVGDIDAATLQAVLDEIFGGLPATGTTRNLEDAPVSSRGGVEVIDFDNPQSTVNFAGPGVSIDDPDFIPSYVLNYTLGGGGFSSRLMEEVREKRGLTYGIYTYFQPYERAGLFYGQVASDNEKVGETLAITKQEIEKIRAEGVTETELDDAKRYLTGAFPLGFSSNASIAARLLAYQLYGYDVTYINTRNARINAVTMDDTRRVAKLLPSSDEITFVVVGKPVGLETEE